MSDMPWQEERDMDQRFEAHQDRLAQEADDREVFDVTRENQAAENLYVVADGRIFVVAPDGIGRYYYDTEDEAQEQHGDHLVAHHVGSADE